MKIAISEEAEKLINFKIEHPTKKIKEADFTEICGAILTQNNLEEIQIIKETKFKIPIILLTKKNEICTNEIVKCVDKIIDIDEGNTDIHTKQVETIVSKFEQEIESPFFHLVKEYVKIGKNQFNCPGHHGGVFFEKHPAGKAFINFYGKNIFRSDLCIADAELGDLLIHDGPPCDSEKFAAKIFNADKTYFVLNGSSGSVKTALSALVTPGDLILYDRNRFNII